MSARVAVSQPVLSWALQRSERTFEDALTKFPKLGDWMESLSIFLCMGVRGRG